MAGVRLRQAVPAIRQTVGLVHDISEASKDQSAASRKVADAVRRLEQIIRRNASAAEELSATSTDFTAESEKLYRLASFFSLGGPQQTVRESPRSGSPRKSVLPERKRTPTKVVPLPGAESKAGIVLEMGPEPKEHGFEPYTS
jgi:methyl-accepting chemotaxis protein